MPEARIETSVTSASPIISAAAVEAVRCGLRRALSWASAPAAPPIRVAGHPSTATSGRTKRTESIEMPMKMSSAPRPIQPSTPVVPSPLPKRP